MPSELFCRIHLDLSNVSHLVGSARLRVFFESLMGRSALELLPGAFAIGGPAS